MIAAVSLAMQHLAAELGDRPIHIVGYSTGASLALILASAIGVFAGAAISEYVNEKTLHYIAGIGFVGIGIWMLVKA